MIDSEETHQPGGPAGVTPRGVPHDIPGAWAGFAQWQYPAQTYGEPFAPWAMAPPVPQLPVASLGRRIAAYVIDGVLEVVLIGIPFVVMGIWLGVRLGQQRGRPPEIPGLGVMVAVGVVLIVLGILYRPVCEARWGKTVGKALVKIRVVMEDGRPCTGVAALLRYLLFVVDGLLSGIVGLVIAITDDTGRYQRLGDRVAHTVVVDETAYRSMGVSLDPYADPLGGERVEAVGSSVRSA